MKKILAVLTVLLVVMSLSACAPKKTTYELALVTDIGTIDDKSFNQGAWEGVKQYADENDITYQYYKPTEASDAAYLAAIALAVEGGAKVVVTPGYMFAPAILEAQDLYPDVKFVLLDADPHNADYTELRIEDNVYSIYYAEEQSGFLAGYAAVIDGYTNLGFFGGMAVPAVVRFGHGFVQGAEVAAAEKGINVTVKYEYLNTFGPSADVQTKAAAWYAEGVEVIFAAAGGAGLSAMAAADATTNAKVIGVDVDQSNLSASVISSATKGLTTSVYGALTDYYAGTFKGGVIDTLDVAKDGVGLPMATSKFTVFNQAKYDEVFAKLVAGTIVVKKDAAKVVDLVVPHVVVTVIGAE